MKKILSAFIAAACISLLIPSISSAQKASYEGTAVCKMCHQTDKQGKQFKIWQESKHSQAYTALQSAKADEIAKAKTSKKAVESPECLKCHATGFDAADKSLLGAKYKVEEGIQCETCHGAGSAYKSLAVMKNKEEAVKKGLTIHKDAAKYCQTCHNPQSPTYKEFKYEEAWAKIKHPVPNS